MEIKDRFSAPYNDASGIAETFLSLGKIEKIDLNSYTATVFTNHGMVSNVRIPLPFYSKGTGIFATPEPGDYVILGWTPQSDAIILSYFIVDPFTSSQKALRPTTKDGDTFWLQSRLGGQIILTDSVNMQTNVGAHLRLSGNPDYPVSVLESPEHVEISAGTPSERTVIKVITSDYNPIRMIIRSPENVTITIDKQGVVTTHAKKYDFVADVDPATYAGYIALETAANIAGTPAGVTNFSFTGPLVGAAALQATNLAAAQILAGTGVAACAGFAVALSSINNDAYPWRIRLNPTLTT